MTKTRNQTKKMFFWITTSPPPPPPPPLKKKKKIVCCQIENVDFQVFFNICRALSSLGHRSFNSIFDQINTSLVSIRDFIKMFKNHNFLLTTFEKYVVSFISITMPGKFFNINLWVHMEIFDFCILVNLNSFWCCWGVFSLSFSENTSEACQQKSPYFSI